MRIAIAGCFLWCLVLNQAFAQTVNSNLNDNDSVRSFQTAHVHFDKDIYLPGETIWFKAYLYNINEVSLGATNFYAAIYDEQGKLLQQKQYPITAGSCNGDFEIADTIESSRLQFRAFTKAMLAEDSNNVYEKMLTIYNKKNNAENITQPKTKQLQFFAEGGKIIAELQNEIAFKATYTDGTAAKISGEIIEVERGMLVDSFATNDMGMGTFFLIPVPHKTYKAVWTDEKGKKQETMLPEIERYGVSFHATIARRELQYNVARNITNDSVSELHLIAQMGNYQLYKASLVIKNEMEMATAKFSIDSFPEGLLQLTLFDKNWNVLQQRMMYIHTAEKKDMVIVKTDTINFSPKGKNIVEIILADSLLTDLSVSVADINFYEWPNAHTITQDLLLYTQLKEEDENAMAFLNYDNDIASQYTLTRQWKKYNWRKLVINNQNKQTPADNYISLSVNYKDKNHALPKDDALNLIINKGQSKQFYNLLPASQTSFKKDGLVFFDSVKVLYQMDRNKELANYLSITKDSALKMPFWVNALPAKINLKYVDQVSVKSNLETFVSFDTGKFNGVKTFKEVVVKSKYKGNPVLERIDELDKFYTSGMFSGAKGYQLNVIDDTVGVAANNDVQDYLRMRLPGLHLYDGSFKVKKLILDEQGKPRMEWVPVKIFIDETEIETDSMNGNPLMGFDLSSVAYVKYIPGIVIGAGFTSNTGAIYIYTKKGTEKGPPMKGLPFVYIRGYNSAKEFTGPDYANQDQNHQPDRRTTLYWNPNVLMDKTNNTLKVVYYNNDVSKKHLLKIEGVNAAGQLIYVEKILE
jgi:hypothetical protein